jgi:hypothetical protein
MGVTVHPVHSLQGPLSLSHQYNFISQLIKIPARWLVRSHFQPTSRLALSFAFLLVFSFISFFIHILMLVQQFSIVLST